MLKGALAAAVTPLQDGGEALDEAAFGPYVDFLAGAGVDGLLALGTTGEGFLLPLEQRMRAAQLFVEAAGGRLDVAVHCGAQSTRDTVELAAHASDPVPFYVYEFAARSGYAVPLMVLERLREAAPNFRGLKVSDTPWEAFAHYLIEGLDVFVGPEALLGRGLAAGAAGAVSALASVFPELVVAAVRDPGSADLGPVRAALERFPFQAAAKVVLRARGVPIGPDVRRPLRTLTTAERGELGAWLESSSPAAAL